MYLPSKVLVLQLNCAMFRQVIEKLWGSAKLTQQRLESVSSGGSLQYQQLQERLESINKQARDAAIPALL